MIEKTDIKELKRRIEKGDFVALELLHKSYYRKLKLYGIQFSPKLSSLSVDDSIQELFIWLYKNYRKLNTIKNLEVYLFSALKQNIYQDIHKVQSRENLRVLYSRNTIQEKYEHSDETKFIRSEKKEQNKLLVKNYLDALPDQQKEVMYLRNYVNMSYREIADVMKLSEQTVRNYSHRALQKMKERVLENQEETKLRKTNK